VSPASSDPRPADESSPTDVDRPANPAGKASTGAPPDAANAPNTPNARSTPDADAPPGQRAGIGRGKGRRGGRIVHHFKVDEALAPDDRTAYEALLLDPRQTCDSLTAWLHARGYKHISRGAVHRHRHNFEKDVLEIRKSAKIAGQFSALARAQGGAGGLADASQFRLEQMFLERVFALNKEERLSGKEWGEFGKAMSTLLDTRRQYETLRTEWEEKARRAAEAVQRAGDAAGGGGGGGRPKVFNGVEIANAVRRILGVPLPGEPVPDGPSPGRAAAALPTPDERRGIEIANEVRRKLGAPPVGGAEEN